MDALLLIDFQRDFLAKDGRMPIGAEKAEHLIVVANRLIDYLEKKAGLLIFIGNEFSRMDFIGNLFRRFSAVEGSDGVQLDPRVSRQGYQYFRKTKSDAFSNPALDAYLKNHGATRLFVMGVYSEGCIRATTVGAMKRGYQVVVVADAVASRGKFRHEWALSYMRKRGATLVNSKQLLAQA